MAFNNLSEFLNALESAGELVRIKTFVDPRLEIAEITDRISKTASRNKALLFENTGYDFPVLMNAYGSEKRMCIALGVDRLDDISKEIESLFKMLAGPKESILDKLRVLPKLTQFAAWMPKVVRRKGECQAVVLESPDLNKLPIITCWPKDGGPFITLPVIHTKDPETGIRNVGMYRMQLIGEKVTGMHWHKHKVSARHFEAYKKLKKRMPVAVAMGGDPVYAYAATAPLPDNVDEYMLAGFLRKKKVELVRCLTQPELEVPADADIVIEGYVDPEEAPIWEGPFGDHTGYYSLPDWYPSFRVTAITHKKNAIYPATIVGIPPQEDAWLGKATERIFLAPMKMMMIPEIVDMEMPVEGVFHNLVIAQIHKTFAGHGQKVMSAMWGAGQMMFNKILVLVDEGVSITDYLSLAKYVFKNLNPATDIAFAQGPMDVLDHSCSKLGFGGKMCIDGTRKFEEEMDERYAAPDKIHLPENGWSDGFPEIKNVNGMLLEKGIPCIIISVLKTRKGQVRDLHRGVAQKILIDSGVKLILYVDENIDPANLQVALWRFCNNLDPKRDSLLFETRVGDKIIACMGLDGTTKTEALDDFHRDWPNIIVADEKTIDAVDKKWNQLGLGDFIPSPSLSFRDQLYGEEAVAAV
ncbi:MAG TPA: menaquinone biosynthesis decarboxylase [Puia sp.]|nr:menaquinone biosynthesis decarboxylase [Puia sp.]